MHAWVSFTSTVKDPVRLWSEGVLSVTFCSGGPPLSRAFDWPTENGGSPSFRSIPICLLNLHEGAQQKAIRVTGCAEGSTSDLAANEAFTTFTVSADESGQRWVVTVSSDQR